MSSQSCSCRYGPISSFRPGSSRPDTVASASCLPLSPRNEMIWLLFLSYTPLNSLPQPIGQFIGYVLMPSSCSISSSRSKGLRASRSILLMNVKIGMSRSRQTLNSFLVCASTPFEASITITAESAAISVRYVSSEKS